MIKTPIGVNPSAFILCDVVCSSSVAEELEYIYRLNYLELIKECKDDLMTYYLCILILFECDLPEFVLFFSARFLFYSAPFALRGRTFGYFLQYWRRIVQTQKPNS